MTKSSQDSSKIKTIIKFWRAHRWCDWVALGLVCLGIIVCNDIWICAELRPPHWDMARHLLNSLGYLDLARNDLKLALLQNYSYYPPFLYWLTVPSYAVFGTGIRQAVATNSLFIVTLAFSTYGLGYRLWGRRTGLLAALFVLSAPMLVTQFKEYQLDAPTAAMVAVSLYLLVRTKEFRDRTYSLVFGVVFGLTLLTKWTTVFVLALPLAYAASVAVAEDVRKRQLNNTYHIVFSLLLTYVVASFWYVTNLEQIKIDLLINGKDAGVREGDPVVGSLASNLWYVKNLITSQLYMFPTLLFLVGTIVSFAKGKHYFKRNIYPWLLTVGTLVFFTLLRNKDPRYTLPMLVGVAIVAVFWIGQIKHQLWKLGLSFVVTAYFVVTFFVISFGSSLVPGSVGFKLGNTSIPLFAPHGYIIGPPSSENWHQEEVFETIASGSMPKVFLGSGPDSIWFNQWGNRYFAKRYGVGIVGESEQAYYVLQQPGEIAPWPQSIVIMTYTQPDGTTLELVQRQP